MLSIPLDNGNLNYNENFHKLIRQSDSSFNIVDLGAIKKNYILLRNKHKKGICGAVVKADACGLGLENVAQALFDVGCRDFFVFDLKEGIRLRKRFNLINIYIINSLLKEIKESYEENFFIPILSDLQQIEIWNKFCKEKEKRLDAIIQFDTGMHRGGLDEEETQILFSHPEFFTNIKIKYLMSHLACAEMQDNLMNYSQNKIFRKICEHFKNIPATLANSGGIFLGPDFHYDLLRPGVALYGISPTPYKKENPMVSVLQTYARIMQFHFVKKGESIGYGKSYVSTHKKRIAMVNIGYSNGYPYSLNNKPRYCYIRDWKVPILGGITMNSIMIDVTDVPASSIQSGDLVELMGSRIKMEEISEQSDTITREILCRLAAGGEKIYIDSTQN